MMLLLWLQLLTSVIATALSDHLSLPPHYEYNPIRSKRVKADYSWQNRQTGIFLGQWQTGIGHWEHYRPSDLLVKAKAKPWSSGLMRKHLKKTSGSQFELWSVYEASARGGFNQGMMAQRENDGHYEHQYSFRETPHRLTDLSTLIPNLVPDWDRTIRAIIVQPRACTFSGKLWIPTPEQQSEVHDKDNVLAFQTYELWLAEDYKSVPEGRKVGVFLQYDGITGELQQVFQMHEVTCPGVKDPSLPINFGEYSDLHPQISQEYESNAKDSTLVSGRIVHLQNGPQEAEHACEFSNQPLCTDFGVQNTSQYLTLMLNNGLKVTIPKSFNEKLNGRLLLQAGCPRADGGFHRITVLGERKQQGFSTLCYERW